MAIMTLKEAAELCKGRIVGDPSVEIKTFVTDSRKATPGCMFVALKGENTDGNKYLEAAIESPLTAMPQLLKTRSSRFS